MLLNLFFFFLLTAAHAFCGAPEPSEEVQAMLRNERERLEREKERCVVSQNTERRSLEMKEEESWKDLSSFIKYYQDCMHNNNLKKTWALSMVDSNRRFYDAVESGDLDTVKAIIEADIEKYGVFLEIDGEPREEVPLRIAVKTGNYQMVQY